MIFVLLSFVFIYNPKFVPKEIKGANKGVIDKVIGKDLSAKIDETRDENSATTIRKLFNLNKEENKEEHCRGKEEREQEQDRCENPVDDEKDNEGKKTYRNEEFGYSVKYPGDWGIYKAEGDTVSFAEESDIHQLRDNEIKYIDTDTPFTFGKLISVGKLENPDNLSLQNYANKNLMFGGEGFSQERISKNKIAGLYVYDKGPGRFGGGVGEYFLFNIKNDLYAVWLDHDPLSDQPNKNLSDIFNIMVDSLKI